MIQEEEKKVKEWKIKLFFVLLMINEYKNKKIELIKKLN